MAGGFDHYVWAVFMQLRELGALTQDSERQCVGHWDAAPLSHRQEELLRIVTEGTRYNSRYYRPFCPLMLEVVDDLAAKGAVTGVGGG